MMNALITGELIKHVTDVTTINTRVFVLMMFWQWISVVMLLDVRLTNLIVNCIFYLAKKK